jgi:hypothetical protein
MHQYQLFIGGGVIFYSVDTHKLLEWLTNRGPRKLFQGPPTIHVALKQASS